MASDLVKFEMDLNAPTEELLNYAKEHLNEDPDTKLEILSELRDLIFERGECSPHRLDDDFLLRFLRARNFVVRHAHRLLVNYYEFKENNPEFYEDVYFDRLTAIGDANLMMTQPFCDQSGRRFLFYRLGLWDPDKISVRELFQATLLTLELGALEPSAQILGGVCIFDLRGIKFNHARHLTPKIVTKIIDIMVFYIGPRLAQLGNPFTYVRAAIFCANGKRLGVPRLQQHGASYHSDGYVKAVGPGGRTNSMTVVRGVGSPLKKRYKWTYPIRTHAIHVVNQSPVFKAGYSVVKPFLNKEIKKRLFFHGNMSSLHQHVDPKFLPKRYGGVHPDYSYGEWVEYMKKSDPVKKELKDLGYTLEEQVLGKS